MDLKIYIRVIKSGNFNKLLTEYIGLQSQIFWTNFHLWNPRDIVNWSNKRFPLFAFKDLFAQKFQTPIDWQKQGEIVYWVKSKWYEHWRTEHVKIFCQAELQLQQRLRLDKAHSYIFRCNGVQFTYTKLARTRQFPKKMLRSIHPERQNVWSSLTFSVCFLHFLGNGWAFTS